MTDSAQLEDFRARCKAFLDEHATGIDYAVGESRAAASIAAAKTFQRALTDAGLAGLTYPVEYGGQGLPVLNQFGTDEQKRQFMPKNISGENIWCQMFSEPGAGSDVASLQTKAERDGDEWILNGQKVWTTLAHVSDYGVVIARTDPTVPKHAGISMFIIDMNNPGVEIRPIHQIDGGSHFNEVFFTDARIPADWLLGELNHGWSQATAMLMYERVAIGTGATSGITTPIADRFIAEAKRRGTSADPVVRQHLMRVLSEETTKALVSMRTRAELKAGKAPGPGGIASMVRSLTGDVVGFDLTAWDPDSKGDQWARGILTAFQANIAGGTDEIQKNIIGDRVLGLPREPAVDRDVPFNELRVGTQRKD